MHKSPVTDAFKKIRGAAQPRPGVYCACLAAAFRAIGHRSKRASYRAPIPAQSVLLVFPFSGINLLEFGTKRIPSI